MAPRQSAQNYNANLIQIDQIKQFNLIVDTGSSNTWVGVNTKFSAGSTGISTGKSFSVTYGRGSGSGTEYTDTVALGSATVNSQSIGVANITTAPDDIPGVDGFIGFGPVDETEGTVSCVSLSEIPLRISLFSLQQCLHCPDIFGQPLLSGHNLHGGTRCLLYPLERL